MAKKMKKIILKTQNKYLQEKKYIFDILFNEFLGVSYKLLFHDKPNYEIYFSDKKIIIQDSFFSKIEESSGYLNKNNIPETVEFMINPMKKDEKLVIIYGDNLFKKQNDNVFCGLDIFSSSFFMLTRWEEFVKKERDIHGRFSYRESLAYKNNFLHKPIVNQYVDLLLWMLNLDNKKIEIKKRKYKIKMTHDVDDILAFSSKKNILSVLVGDLIKRKSIKLFCHSLKCCFEYIFYKKDPYDTFDFLMSISEKIGIKSNFYFMGYGQTKFDNRYNSADDFIKEVIKKIQRRKHCLGLHYSYKALEKTENISLEKKEIEKVINLNIKEGRNHYLRLEIPDSWSILEKNGIKKDSTLGYSGKNGFRTGCCYEYSVFDFIKREKKKIKEVPLIFMDVNIENFIKKDLKDVQNELIELSKEVKKHNGTFVILWHNSNLSLRGWKKYKNLLESLGEICG